MAPVLQVNNEFVENVTTEKADALIERLQQGGRVESHPGDWEATEHTAAVRQAAAAAGYRHDASDGARDDTDTQRKKAQ